MSRLTRSLLFSAVSLLVSSAAMAQESAKASDTIAPDGVPSYPLLKVLSVTYDHAFKSDYKIRYKGAPDEEGEFTRGRTQVYFWFPFIKTKHFTWSVAETYTREDVTTRNVTNPSDIYVNANRTLEDYNTALNLNYRTMLFSRQFVINGSFFLGTSPAFKFQKASGMVYGILILKDSPNTVYSVGLGGLIDPSAPLPVIPVGTYWHRFENRRWEVDIVVPQTAKIRRSNTLGGWVSAGVDFTPQSFFIRNIPGEASTFESAFTELTPNLSYDKLFFKNIMLTVQGGYRIGMRGRVGQVNDPARDRIANVEFNSGMFVKGGISYVVPNWQVRRTLEEAKK